MKRLTLIVVSLIIPCVALSSSIRVAQASNLHAKTIPLESQHIVANNGATVISPDSNSFPNYQDTPIKRGLLIHKENHVEIQLDKKFDTLSGTIYAIECSEPLVFSIANGNNSTSPTVIFRTPPGFNGEKYFSVSVRGVTVLFLDNKSSCNDTQAVVVADLTPSSSSSPSSTPRQFPQVVARYPTNNAGVPANSKVLIGWNSYPGAVNYLFHVWVVSTDPSAIITAKTPLAYSATVYRSTKYTWDDSGFPTGTYQYALLPLNAKGKALAAWSTPTQVTISS